MPPSPRAGKLGAGASRVIAYLDANIVIYVVEHHPFFLGDQFEQLVISGHLKQA